MDIQFLTNIEEKYKVINLESWAIFMILSNLWILIKERTLLPKSLQNQHSNFFIRKAHKMWASVLLLSFIRSLFLAVLILWLSAVVVGESIMLSRTFKLDSRFDASTFRILATTLPSFFQLSIPVLTELEVRVRVRVRLRVRVRVQLTVNSCSMAFYRDVGVCCEFRTVTSDDGFHLKFNIDIDIDINID